MGKIGIIGGSALYEMDGLKVVGRKKISTPFGDASDEFVIGTMQGKEVVFLPRHGRGHKILPTELNYRANMYGFKVLDVNRVISVSAVGSLRKEMKPLDVVLVDQFVDRTNQSRSTTFFGEGIVAHIPFADPVCAELKDAILEGSKGAGVTVHNGGTYINMEGPAFSTKAESNLYRSWGMDIIGMTNMPEARLAREAGICYATMAMVTDYDCWHMEEGIESVTIEIIIETLNKNVDAAKKILANTIKLLPDRSSCACAESLRNAIVTRKEDIPQKTLEKLGPIIDGFI